MKYSQKYVWKCVGKILPGLLQAKNNGVHMNLPSSLKSAACECWIRAEETEFKLNFDVQCAAYVVRVALKELEQDGWMTFGEVESF